MFLFALLIFVYSQVLKGKEFHEKHKNKKFVKLTSESCIHNGVKYKEGRIDDILDFDPTGSCKPGGLYFVEFDNFVHWMEYGGKKMVYLWDVEIPNDCEVYDEGNKYKTNCFIITNKINIWESEELSLAAVKQDGWVLEFVQNQTPEICMAAVTQNGWALQFVKVQTPEICLAAVKQNGWALKFVHNQTPEICLAAVTQDGLALKFVHNKTPEICLASVKQD